MQVPKNIMQTWKNNTIPDHWVTGPKAVKKLNKEWKYYYQTDDDNKEFMQKNFPQYLDFYEKLPYNIQRADFIRYAWLYVYGGIYIDMDYEPQVTFDHILSQVDDCDLCFIATKDANNSFIAAKQGCEFWLELMENITVQGCNPWYLCFERHLYILNSSGPGAIERTIQSTKGKYKISSFPQNTSYNCKCSSNSPPGYMLKMLKGRSWVTSGGEVAIYLICNSGFLVGILLLVILIIILLIFYRP